MTPLTLTPGQPVTFRRGRRKVLATFKGYRQEVRKVAHVISADGKSHFLMPEKLEALK